MCVFSFLKMRQINEFSSEQRTAANEYQITNCKDIIILLLDGRTWRPGNIEKNKCRTCRVRECYWFHCAKGSHKCCDVGTTTLLFFFLDRVLLLWLPKSLGLVGQDPAINSAHLFIASFFFLSFLLSLYIGDCIRDAESNRCTASHSRLKAKQEEKGGQMPRSSSRQHEHSKILNT